jgi:hypothetical protein
LSPEGTVMLSVDSASAEIGRPLTATSTAGVNRRVHRRAYRRGNYGNYGYGYGTSQPSYGYGYAYEPSTQQTYSGYGGLACGRELTKQCGGVPVVANNMRECLQKSQGKLSERCVGLANACRFLAMQCGSRYGFPAPVKYESRAVILTDGFARLPRKAKEAAARTAI